MSDVSVKGTIMMTIRSLITSGAAKPGIALRRWARVLSAAAGITTLVAGTLSPAAFAAAPPATGDAYVYRLVNGYNKETRGQLRYQVSRVEPDRITISVTPDNPEAGAQRTDVYTQEGNWLRHPVESHGKKVEYEFVTAYPAYVFPLEPGKSWSVRVKATVPDVGRERSVRVDGRVIGNERIRVPAGEFDTVKIRRFVYPGDTDFMLSETQIVEFEWYAPALGRAVRTERTSTYLDFNSCGEDGLCDARGDWDVFELVESHVIKR